MSRQLVCDALTMALWHRGFPRGVLFHSDRGSQYCSHDYQKMLKHYGLISSISRKGNCWDNAVAESFFHGLKTELIYAEKYATREIAKQSIFQYIEVYYNRFRRHATLGSIAPMVFENQYKIVVQVCLKNCGKIISLAIANSFYTWYQNRYIMIFLLLINKLMNIFGFDFDLTIFWMPRTSRGT